MLRLTWLSGEPSRLLAQQALRSNQLSLQAGRACAAPDLASWIGEDMTMQAQRASMARLVSLALLKAHKVYLIVAQVDSVYLPPAAAAR